ncbi:glycosyltransferase [Aliivibrio fischeri]|uniref:glycosyltransferase n=1 Tax=Aliivibrio fischeri TaxID=668 RepID=UPI00080EAD69|nr:glycosyltransferase [Aliivibrio fischeri]OCH05713.1 glycosyl transferase [Aliivibrio fischeri]
MNNVATIMSVYKHDNADFFEIAVNSMLTQTLKTDIYIFIDGELNSGLLSSVNKYRIYDNVFIVESKENVGLAMGLNSLIDCIISGDKKYKYIARMDSDDISYAYRLEKQVAFLSKNNHISVLGCFCHEFGSTFALDRKVLPENHDALLEFSITRCPFIHPTVVFNIDIFIKGFRYPTNTKFTEDMAFWLLLLDEGYIFSNLNEVLLDYRLNEDTVSRRKGIDKALSEIKIRLKYMFRLNKVSLKNSFLIFSRLVFHILPDIVIKRLYIKLR